MASKSTRNILNKKKMWKTGWRCLSLEADIVSDEHTQAAIYPKVTVLGPFNTTMYY